MEELRTGAITPEVTTAIRLGADLKIPKSFLADEMLRLRVYKNIASARNEQEIDMQYQDLEDRFGALPPPIENLLEYSRLRLIGASLGVRSMEKKAAAVDIVFDQQAHIDPERIVQLVGEQSDVIFTPPATLRIKVSGSTRKAFQRIQDVLNELA